MRITKERLCSVITEAIENNKKASSLIIAIDGRSASGKTTFAKRLAALGGVAVIHTDDFYRPKNSEGKLEISRYEGNFDIERFKREIVEGIAEEEFQYGVFDCKEQKITKTVTVASPKCIIVEGAYSTHPSLGDYADITAFFDIDEIAQRERIIARNGESAYNVFENIWIQAEERYFKHYKTKETVHYIITEENNGNF